MVDFLSIDNKDGFYVFGSLPGTIAATATNYGVIFIAMRPCEILKVSEAHTNAGSDATAALNIERLSGTESLNSGDEVLVADINLNTGAADTVITRSGVALQNTILVAGDRLAIKDIGTLTAVAGVCVTIYLKPLGKGNYGV